MFNFNPKFVTLNSNFEFELKYEPKYELKYEFKKNFELNFELQCRSEIGNVFEFRNR